MASIDDFSLPMRLFFKGYPWRRIDPLPWVSISRPVNQCKLGIVTSAGFSTPEQEPFDRSIKGGDWSFRVIPDGVNLKSLKENHRSPSFDHRGLAADPNLAFPLDRVHELLQLGELGAVNHRHLSFMGSIIATGRLRTQSAPEAAGLFKEDQVDIALFVPV